MLFLRRAPRSSESYPCLVSVAKDNFFIRQGELFNFFFCALKFLSCPCPSCWESGGPGSLVRDKTSLTLDSNMTNTNIRRLYEPLPKFLSTSSISAYHNFYQKVTNRLSANHFCVDMPISKHWQVCCIPAGIAQLQFFTMLGNKYRHMGNDQYWHISVLAKIQCCHISILHNP